MAQTVSSVDTHLKLLAIFHYVVGGLTVVFSCFVLIHLVMGILMVTQPDMFSGAEDPEGVPAFVGWLFIGIASAVLLIGWGLGLAIVLAGRFLQARRYHTYCLVIAGVECLLMPHGTVLGVFSLLILLKPEVTEGFNA